MTLFEAIRGLKEGQAIEERIPGGPYRKVIVWEHEKDFRIVDLPKPKMSLEEGLEKVERDVFVEVAETDTSTVLYALWSKRPSISKAILSKLRSLPIDWQAEADRKEGKA